MPDREKVINFIESEINTAEKQDQTYRAIDLPTLRDILSLLKEQEETICAYAELLIKYGYEFTKGR